METCYCPGDSRGVALFRRYTFRTQDVPRYCMYMTTARDKAGQSYIAARETSQCFDLPD